MPHRNLRRRLEAREHIIGVDEELRRVAYEVMGDGFGQHNAAMQILPARKVPLLLHLARRFPA